MDHHVVKPRVKLRSPWSPLTGNRQTFESTSNYARASNSGVWKTSLNISSNAD